MSYLYIGIDPDVKASGYCLWNKEEKKIIELSSLPFWDLHKKIIHIKNQCKELTIIIDSGWLNKKSNFHYAKNKGTSDKISMQVGRNHQVGLLLVELFKEENINYIEHKPKGKVSKDYFQKLTKYMKRTNKDQRDACMLVYGI